MSERSVAQAPVKVATPAQPAVLQRACACGQHSNGEGKCEQCKKRGQLQRKLAVGASNDPLEQEADRVANQVLTGSLPALTRTGPLSIRRLATQPSGQVGTAPASVDRALASSGRPLEPALQQDMGQRFGYDFSRVRVHTGGAAEQSAREVSALAYTVSNNVVFGSGEYAPDSARGRRVLAHELTHVVQQGGHETKMMLQRKEENNADLAAIQGFAMYDLLVQLTKLPENVLDDEEAGGFVGGPRLVTAMRAARAKMQKDGDFLGNNRREIQALPPDQAADILRFLAQDSEGKGQKSINTDLEVDVTIVAPSAIQLRGEQQGGLQGEGAARGGHELSTDHISEFEEGLLNDRSAITGVVLDPESREIIGYRTLRADGISRLVDREGAFVVDAGTPLGLQPPVVDPIDFTPNPAALAKGAAKAGVGIVGKVVLSGAVKKGAASGGKVTLGAIIKMRNVAKALAKKALSPRSEALAFIRSVRSGAKVTRTLSVQAAEELVGGKLGRFMAEDLNKMGTIGPFEAFQVLTRGHGGAYQAHHIVESSVLKHLGHDVGKAPSVILRAGEHSPLSTLLATEIPKGELEHLTKKQLLQRYEVAYKNYPAWIAEVRRYFK